MLEEQIDEIMDGIREIKNSNGERFTIKELERTRKSLEARLKKLNDDREMKILIQKISMGKGSSDCKGFFIVKSRIRMIVLNSDLSEQRQRIMLAHELGHAVLHSRDSALKAFHDFELFDETSVYEYEANIFVAEFLLKDDQVLELLNEDMSFFTAAQTLHVPAELLDFKFRVLKRRGYALNSPICAHANFMRDIGHERMY